MTKSNTDWREALAALAPEAPEAPEASEAPCAEAAGPKAPPSGTLTVFYERKGRGGKEATIIAGFECDDSELRAIASTLKQRLGTGGSARGGEILVQGDRRAAVAAALRGMGYRVKGDVKP